MKLKDLHPGGRVIRYGRSATVLFCKETHSARSFIGYVLLQYDGNFGWEADPECNLLPEGEEHIRGLNHLHWVPPGECELLEQPMDYEVDE
jgi:hypothetical protein